MTGFNLNASGSGSTQPEAASGLGRHGLQVGSFRPGMRAGPERAQNHYNSEYARDCWQSVASTGLDNSVPSLMIIMMRGIGSPQGWPSRQGARGARGARRRTPFEVRLNSRGVQVNMKLSLICPWLRLSFCGRGFDSGIGLSNFYLAARMMQISSSQW